MTVLKIIRHALVVVVSGSVTLSLQGVPSQDARATTSGNGDCMMPTSTTMYCNNFTEVAGGAGTVGTGVIDVAGLPAAVEDVNVYLYGADSDGTLAPVKFTIVAPDGTTVPLIYGACRFTGSGSGVRLIDQDFIVDDQAAAPLAQQTTNGAGQCWRLGDPAVIRPSSYDGPPKALSTIFGRPANGRWTIQASGLSPVRLLRGFGLGITAGTPPETLITAGPHEGDVTGNRTSFEFTSPNTPSAHFECSLDGQGFAPCTSPVTRSSLTVARHLFAVRARSQSGLADETSAHVSWFVGPETVITSGPAAGAVTGGSVSFSFTSPDAPGARFECQVDGGPFFACASPYHRTGLPTGSHVFGARAVTNGLTDASPAQVSWSVVAGSAGPGLVISRAKLDPRARLLVVKGGIDPAATGRVRIDYQVRVQHRTLRGRTSAMLQSGRFTGRLKLPVKAAHGARKLVVTVSYAGDSTFGPQAVTKIVRISGSSSP